MSSRNGVWSVAGHPQLEGRYYLFDRAYMFRPCRRSLRMWSPILLVGVVTQQQKSQIVNLEDPLLSPPGWEESSATRPEASE